jgi:K(+)-stimulated pyrophosphate-energized sodium pump
MNPSGAVTGMVSKEVTIEKTNVDGKVKATIKTNINGKEDTQNFEGTDAEVQAKIDSLK